MSGQRLPESGQCSAIAESAMTMSHCNVQALSSFSVEYIDFVCFGSTVGINRNLKEQVGHSETLNQESLRLVQARNLVNMSVIRPRLCVTCQSARLVQLFKIFATAALCAENGNDCNVRYVRLVVCVFLSFNSNE